MNKYSYNLLMYIEECPIVPVETKIDKERYNVQYLMEYMQELLDEGVLFDGLNKTEMKEVLSELKRIEGTFISIKI